MGYCDLPSAPIFEFSQLIANSEWSPISLDSPHLIYYFKLSALGGTEREALTEVIVYLDLSSVPCGGGSLKPFIFTTLFLPSPGGILVSQLVATLHLCC